jgi:hypothetical protein
VTRWRAQVSPNAPRPDDPLIVEIADLLRRIEARYDCEGSGPGSRFEGRLLEDVQAEAVVRRLKLAARGAQVVPPAVVCSACLTEACAAGVLLCEDARAAGIILRSCAHP